MISEVRMRYYLKSPLPSHTATYATNFAHDVEFEKFFRAMLILTEHVSA